MVKKEQDTGHQHEAETVALSWIEMKDKNSLA